MFWRFPAPFYSLVKPTTKRNLEFRIASMGFVWIVHVWHKKADVELPFFFIGNFLFLSILPFWFVVFTIIVLEIYRAFLENTNTLWRKVNTRSTYIIQFFHCCHEE